MKQKNVTLSLDDQIYEDYRKYCKNKGIALSRSIEIFMEERIKNGMNDDR